MPSYITQPTATKPFTDYEVNFDNQIIAVFYETRLRLVLAADDTD